MVNTQRDHAAPCHQCFQKKIVCFCYADVRHMISRFQPTERFYADVKLEASCLSLKDVKGGN